MLAFCDSLPSPFPIPLEEILNSALIAEPLHLYMTSTIADGTAAAILCSKDIAKRYAGKRPITVAACVLKSGRYRELDPLDADVPSTITLTANEAYKQTGMEPKEIDLAEVHDSMSPIELVSCENLGFCKKGKACSFKEKDG